MLAQKYGSSAGGNLFSVYGALKKQPDANPKVGCVGFCFGGRMSLLLGINRPLDAVCTFYGGGMQVLFDQIHKLKAPVLALFGDADVSIPAGTIEKFRELLEKNGNVNEIKVYPDSGHAFFRDSDPQAYRPAASQDAWIRAKAFFATNLK